MVLVICLGVVGGVSGAPLNEVCHPARGYVDGDCASDPTGFCWAFLVGAVLA
jgi:hypothetical protein